MKNIKTLNTMSKQTALQELISIIDSHIIKNPLSGEKLINEYMTLLKEKATKFLDKEKEQIIDARLSVTGLNHRSPTDDNNIELAEQYFNQTYKQ